MVVFLFDIFKDAKQPHRKKNQKPHKKKTSRYFDSESEKNGTKTEKKEQVFIIGENKIKQSAEHMRRKNIYKPKQKEFKNDKKYSDDHLKKVSTSRHWFVRSLIVSCICF